MPKGSSGIDVSRPDWTRRVRVELPACCAPREAGVHTVPWNGRDVRGRELASGVYVYRLLAGEELMETRKMALVR